MTERTAAAGAAAARQGDAAAAMPELRDIEAKAAAELQRLVMARRELESEESRVREGIAESEHQLTLIAADIERVQTSCGYAVPLLDYVGQRDTLLRWADSKDDQGLEEYRCEKNVQSIDGLPTPLAQQGLGVGG